MIRGKQLLILTVLVLALLAVAGAPTLAGPRDNPAAAPGGSPAAQGPDDWAGVQKAGKIVFGTAADYPPFEFYSSNFMLDGFDIALAKELGKRMGVEVEFNDFAFDGLLDALELGQVDAAIAAISVTPDRQQVVDFTNLYYISDAAALANKNFKGEVRAATDLANQRVGVQKGTTFQQWAQQNLVDAGLVTQTDLVPFQDANAMVRDLRNGKIDVALMGLLPAQQFSAGGDLRIVGQAFNREKYAIALRTGSTLTDELNAALLEVQEDGTFAKLAKQYLGAKGAEVLPDEEDNVPEPTPTPEATATPGPAPCVWGMAYVADLNLDDKNMKSPPVMKPGQAFTKKWRVRNSGTCAWEPDFTLQYVSGNRPEAEMGAQPVPVGKRIQPGQTVDLAANLVAPSVYGTFQAFWKMHDSANVAFGEVVWVGIQVPNPTPPPPPPPPPAGLNPNLRADSQWINPGECTTIRWDIDGVKSVFFIDGGNIQGVGGHDNRTVCPQVTTTYVLRVVETNNKQTDFPITVNVNGPPAAQINFWVDNGQINSGQCTTLRWDVKNVKEVYLNEQGVAGQGAQQVCPTATTTYTLRVVKQDNSQETRQVTVTVANSNPPPAINSFYPSMNLLQAGQCVDLRWQTSNAQSVNLTRGGTPILLNGPAAGALPDCPPGPGLYDYELTAYGNGQTSQRVTVEVNPPSPQPR